MNKRKYVLFLALPLLAALTALTVCSCSTGKESRPVSIFVAQGFTESVYRALAEDAKKDLGIDVQFVYQCSGNQTGQIAENFRNDLLESDLVFTYAAVPNEYLKNTCLDLMSRSSLLSHYSYDKIREFITDDGCVYQLPLCSRIVGIMYNATLVEEKGLKLPRNYNDMLELKARCDREGIPFAVTDIKYTGHAFNLLFNLMGVKWLNTVNGKVWLNGLFEGYSSMHVFKENAVYFQKWLENGLFGELADISRPARTHFGQQRALFAFTNRNNFYGYKGPMYDSKGRKTGVMLDDKYKVMPWISEDGTNNCFTAYDNNWVMVNKAAAQDEAHLKNVLALLEYLMTNPKYRQMVKEQERDLYFVLGESVMDEDRLFYDYADLVKRGYLQPWFYSSFDEATIIETGKQLASYIVATYKSKGWPVGNTRHIDYAINDNATFDNAMGMLRTSLHSQKEDYLGWAEERITPEGVARMTAVSAGLILQDAVPEIEVCAALMPYVHNLRELQPWKQVPVQNAGLNAGVLHKGYSYIFEPPGCTEVAGVRMKGSELREILQAGYDPSGYFIDPSTGESTFDSEHYGPYPYACMIKGGAALQDSLEYIVAVCPKSLDKEVYDRFLSEDRVLTNSGGTVICNLATGVNLYFQLHPTISNSNISWE